MDSTFLESLESLEPHSIAWMNKTRLFGGPGGPGGPQTSCGSLAHTVEPSPTPESGDLPDAQGEPG